MAALEPVDDGTRPEREAYGVEFIEGERGAFVRSASVGRYELDMDGTRRLRNRTWLSRIVLESLSEE